MTNSSHNGHIGAEERPIVVIAVPVVQLVTAALALSFGLYYAARIGGVFGKNGA